MADPILEDRVRKIALKRYWVVANTILDARCLRDPHISVKYIPTSVDELVIQLTAFVLAEEVQVIKRDYKWPATWWQAVKERWLPGWARRRWPVIYRREHVELVYSALLPKCRLIPSEVRGLVVPKLEDKGFSCEY